MRTPWGRALRRAVELDQAAACGRPVPAWGDEAPAVEAAWRVWRAVRAEYEREAMDEAASRAGGGGRERLMG